MKERKKSKKKYPNYVNKHFSTLMGRKMKINIYQTPKV
jgi:hypothetical protein